MKYLITILVFTISFYSCTNEKEEKQNIVPDNIISPYLMDDILVDIHLAEAALKYQRGKGVDHKIYSNQYFDHVFNNHNISAKQFEESLDYYYKNEKLLNKIYKNVDKELERIKKNLDKES